MKKGKRIPGAIWSVAFLFLTGGSYCYGQNTAEFVQGVSAPRVVLRSTAFNSNNPSGIMGLATAANNFCPGAAIGDLVITNNYDKSIVFGLGAYSNFSNSSNTWLEKMRITNTGLVGIGTAVPTSYLDIVTPNGSAIKVQNTSTVNGSKVGIDFYAGGQSSSVAKAKIEAVDVPVSGASVGNAALAFSTRSNTGGNALERMRITPDGKMGIGHGWVYGTQLDVEAMLHVISANNTNTFKIQNFNGITSPSSVGIDFLTYATTATASKNARIEAVTNTIHSGMYAKSDLAFLVNSDGSINNANLSERMRITSAGNVGIGTTTPGTTLHLHHEDGPVLTLTSPNPGNASEPFASTYALAKCNGCHSLEATSGDAVLRAVNAGNDLIIANNGGSGTTAGEIKFTTGPASGGLEEVRMSISKEGKVIIGKPSLFTQPVPFPTGYKLYVSEGILTEKLKVAVKTTSDWSDYVFGKNYQLKSLKEVTTYIEENKHLPDVPSAEEIVKSGVDVAKMDATLLRKIEELTLYVIQQQKEIDALKIQLEKK